MIRRLTSITVQRAECVRFRKPSFFFRKNDLKLASGVEVLEGGSDTLAHGHLTGTDPHAGVVVLFGATS